MFRSQKERKITMGKQEFVEELNRLRERVEANEKPDIATLAMLTDKLRECHDSESPERMCFICRESFGDTEPMAEMLVSWYVAPDGSKIIGGIHEQHFLNLCRKCHDRLGLEEIWDDYRPQESKKEKAARLLKEAEESRRGGR